MQRDGSSEDRATPASGREPPVIEAQAQDLDAAAAPAGAEQGAAAPEEPAAGVASPRKSGKGLLFGGGALVALAAAGAALWSTPAVRERIVALAPQALQKPSSASGTKVQKDLRSETPAAAQPASPSADSKPAPELGKPAESGNAANPSLTAQSVPAPVVQAPAPADSAVQTPKASPSAKSDPPTSDPPKAAAFESTKSQSAKADQEEATDEMEELSARIDALEAKLDASKVDAARLASGAQVAALAATLERLAGRLDAIESKLAAPKTDQRAPESRENGSDAQSPAARAVVAQSMMQALASGAPVGEHVAALRALGVDGAKLSDLATFGQKGAPSAAQLAKQWGDLRSRIVTAEAPAGGQWSDRLLARAKGLVRIEPVGAQSGESAAAVYSRVEAALQRGDLVAALRESDALPEPAKAAAAEWRASVAQRVKADAAARGVVSESIGALARPKS